MVACPSPSLDPDSCDKATSSTKSSHPPGRCVGVMLKPSQVPFSNHSCMASAMSVGVPILAEPVIPEPRYNSRIVGFSCLTRSRSWALILRIPDRKSTRLNSSHVEISYAVFCLKKKKKKKKKKLKKKKKSYTTL